MHRNNFCRCTKKGNSMSLSSHSPFPLPVHLFPSPLTTSTMAQQHAASIPSLHQTFPHIPAAPAGNIDINTPIQAGQPVDPEHTKIEKEDTKSAHSKFLFFPLCLTYFLIVIGVPKISPETVEATELRQFAVDGTPEFIILQMT